SGGQPGAGGRRPAGVGVHRAGGAHHLPGTAGGEPGPAADPHLPPPLDDSRRRTGLGDRTGRRSAHPVPAGQLHHQPERDHQLHRRQLLHPAADQGVAIVIEIRNVTKSYGAATVVDDVSLTVPPGGITSLVGANGAGKSTLLSIIGRLLEPDSGTVLVDGMDVRTTPGPVLAKRLSVLRQENHLPVRLTVRELVAFGRFPHSNGKLTAVDREHVDRAIEHFELTDLAHRHLDQLSGGQRQRAYVAMVLCQDTDYVLLDEPLNNLDMRHSVQMMRLLRSMADE